MVAYSMIKISPERSILLLALRAFATLAVLGEIAVTRASAQVREKDEPVTLENFIVTGSNIPTAADAVPVPVTFLGPREIERSGLNANLLEVMRKTMPVFSGNGNLGNTNANTANNLTSAGSQASLRNLDTLVLINGRRVSTSGANGRGGRSFVDLNLIPLAAIESVEVLTDGASAIYGADAVGGVVNIKLKHDLQGGAVGARWAVAKSGYNESSAFGVIGASSPHSSITVSTSWSKTDPLLQSDRPFSSNLFGKSSAVSGAVFGTSSVLLSSSLNSPRERNPVGTAATATTLAQLVANGTYGPTTSTDVSNAFDISPYVTLVVGQEQKALVLSHTVDLAGKRLQVFDDFIFTHTDSVLQLAAQGLSGLRVPAASPYNPLTTEISGVSFRYLPAPRVVRNTADMTRATVGLRGELSEKWTWETGYVYSKNHIKSAVDNLIYMPNVALAIAGGYNAQGVPTPGGAYSRVNGDFGATTTNFVIQPALDALARPAGVDPATLENVLGTGHLELASSLKSWDAKVTGQAFNLPAGEIGFAAGVVYTKEYLSGIPDENMRPSVARWSGIAGFEPFSQRRSVKAVFIESRVPLASPRRSLPGAHSLDLTFAYRYEDYNDVGESKAPKYGLRWQPFDEQLTLRYTYSEAFNAPPLFALFGPPAQGSVPIGSMRSVFGPGVDAAQLRTGSNPHLKPSRAKTNSVGFVLSPKAVKGLTLSVDYVHVDQFDAISAVGSLQLLQDVELRGPQSPYTPQVTLDAFAGNPGARVVTHAHELSEFLQAGNQGNRIYVSDTLVNLAAARINTIDLHADYVLPTQVGKFQAATTGTFFLDYQFQNSPSEPFYEYAGAATVGGSGAEGTVPGYRFYSTVSYSVGGWELMIGQTYIPGVVDIGPGGQAAATSATVQRLPVDSFQAWDVQLSYTFGSQGKGVARYLRNLKLLIGVNNAFDEMPPLSKQAFTESNADVATYGSIGRLVFASAQLKF